MKKIVISLIVLFLIVAGASGYFYANRESLLLKKIQKDLQSVTGLGIAIQELDVTFVKSDSFLSMKAIIKRMKLQNPSGFKIPNMALLKDVQIVFDPLPLLLGKWRIHNLSAYIVKAEFEFSPEGQFNIAHLKALQKEAVDSSASINTKDPAFLAERVELQFGTLYYLNYQQAPLERHRFQFDKKLEVYRHVTDPHVLFQAPILMMVNQMNRGSLGISRGKLQENIQQHTAQG